MSAHAHREDRLLKKLKELSPEKCAEVEDFVDFLRRRERDRNLTVAASSLSEPSFAAVWDNDEDAEYDSL